MPETGLHLSEMTYLEPDFIVFSASIRLANLNGSGVLLAVEVADSSLGYDLRRKPSIYAGFGVRELWVIDAPNLVAHVHREPGPGGYANVERRGAAERVVPAEAPAEFALLLETLPLL
jgi:Uma2 family endonuclease